MRFFTTLHDLKKVELSVLGALTLSFFIGIWHAFPMLNVVADEMYFVGGVLRAMENLTIFPAPGDVPYGTLTYVLNYALVALFVLGALPFFGLRVAALKDFLIESPQYAFLIPRLLSALLAVIALGLVYAILRREFTDVRIRLTLTVLLFTNMLTVLLLHTGKVWVLSTVLSLASCYCTYRAVSGNDQGRQRRSIIWAVLFAFFATANFPIFAFSLVCLPLIYYFTRHDRRNLRTLGAALLIGLVAWLLVTLINYQGIIGQVQSIFTFYRAPTVPGSQLSIAGSFWLQLQKIAAFFPLIILAAAFGADRPVRNPRLLLIAGSYFVAYLAAISIVATWANHFYSHIRFSFPLAFFLLLMVASLDVRFSRGVHLVSGVSIVYGLFTMYFLAMPTTYNQAFDWTVNNLNRDVVIQNDVSLIPLPKNKASSELMQDYYCASKCRAIIEKNLHSEFLPLVIDEYTKPEIAATLAPDYRITSVQYTDTVHEQLATFAGGAQPEFAVDGRMANYFDLDVFTIKRFGPDITMYKILR